MVHFWNQVKAAVWFESLTWSWNLEHFMYNSKIPYRGRNSKIQLPWTRNCVRNLNCACRTNRTFSKFKGQTQLYVIKYLSRLIVGLRRTWACGCNLLKFNFFSKYYEEKWECACRCDHSQSRCMRKCVQNHIWGAGTHQNISQPNIWSLHSYTLSPVNRQKWKKTTLSRWKT